MFRLAKILLCIGVVYALSPVRPAGWFTNPLGSSPAAPQPRALGEAPRTIADLAAAATDGDLTDRIDWSQLARIGEAGASEVVRVATAVAARLWADQAEGRAALPALKDAVATTSGTGPARQAAER